MVWEKDVILLCDSNLIEKEEGISFVREEAFKYEKNPVISVKDKKFFLGFEAYRARCECLCYQDGIYRMWYLFEFNEKNKKRFIGYAESNDGYNFKPVKTGRVEFNGSKNNNLIEIVNKKGLSFSSIFYDPVDKEYPFKTLILRRGSEKNLDPALKARWPHIVNNIKKHPYSLWFVWGIGKSKDGFRWELPKNKDNLVDGIIEGPSLYRALDGGYVISNQCVTPYTEIGGRKVKGWVTYDMENAFRIPDYIFALPDYQVRVYKEFLQSEWDRTPWVQSHVKLVPARKGPSMVALHGYLYGAVGTETFAQVADIGLALSNTGYSFHQIWPFRPFIRRGMRGSWDFGLVVQEAILDVKDKTLFYYLASPVGNAAGCIYQIGIAYIERDRYGYRCLKVYRDYEKPKKRKGVIYFKEIKLPENPEIYLNVSNVKKNAYIKMEIRDKRNRIIPGFSFKNCTPVTSSGLKVKVKWENSCLKVLSGKEVKVGIEIFSSECQFADRDSPKIYAIYLK